jgi:hypothetical protein
VSEFLGLPKTLSKPDTSTLHGFWARLSDYCHRQVRPDESWDSDEWIRDGYNLINDVDVYLNNILVEHFFGAYSETNMPDEVREQKRLFIDEEINEAQLRTRLRIMQPVLEQRFRTG